MTEPVQMPVVPQGQSAHPLIDGFLQRHQGINAAVDSIKSKVGDIKNSVPKSSPSAATGIPVDDAATVTAPSVDGWGATVVVPKSDVLPAPHLFQHRQPTPSATSAQAGIAAPSGTASVASDLKGLVSQRLDAPPAQMDTGTIAALGGVGLLTVLLVVIVCMRVRSNSRQ